MSCFFHITICRNGIQNRVLKSPCCSQMCRILGERVLSILIIIILENGEPICDTHSGCTVSNTIPISRHCKRLSHELYLLFNRLLGADFWEFWKQVQPKLFSNELISTVTIYHVNIEFMLWITYSERMWNLFFMKPTIDNTLYATLRLQREFKTLLVSMRMSELPFSEMCSLHYMRGTSIRILTLIWFVLLFCYFCFYICEQWVKATFSSYFVYFLFLVLCLEVYECELKLRNKHARNIQAYSTQLYRVRRCFGVGIHKRFKNVGAYAAFDRNLQQQPRLWHKCIGIL